MFSSSTVFGKYGTCCSPYNIIFLTYAKHSGFYVLPPAVRFKTLHRAHVAYYLGRNVVEEDNQVRYKS